MLFRQETNFLVLLEIARWEWEKYSSFYKSLILFIMQCALVDFINIPSIGLMLILIYHV